MRNPHHSGLRNRFVYPAEYKASEWIWTHSEPIRCCMDIVIQASTEIEWASTLTRTNMQPYYQARGLVWDSAQYEAHWPQFENFSVIYQGQWVGVIRFTSDEQALYLRDLQIEPQYQRLGLGLSCLNYAVEHLKRHHLRRLRLNVFAENPAINLYRRFGFDKVSEVDGLIRMELCI